jgi:hypothetical protein
VLSLCCVGVSSQLASVDRLYVPRIPSLLLLLLLLLLPCVYRRLANIILSFVIYLEGLSFAMNGTAYCPLTRRYSYIVGRRYTEICITQEKEIKAEKGNYAPKF